MKGVRFSFDCPRGTFFDAEYNICDFQHNVKDCDHEGRLMDLQREPLQSNHDAVNVLTDGETMLEPSYKTRKGV